jgi:hypothetical protein
MVKRELGTTDQERLATVLRNAVSFVTNEALMLAQYQAVQKGKFASFWPDGDNGDFEKRMNRVVEHLGGPPEAYLLLTHEEPPPADNYPEAAIREVFAVFSRAHTSVLRAHLFEAAALSSPSSRTCWTYPKARKQRPN